jgi:sortase A
LRKNSRKSSLRLLESGFLLVGLVLLAAFFLARGWGDYQSKSDIAAFEQAVAEQTAVEQTAAEQTVAESTVSVSTMESENEQAPEPDYTLWSSKRVNDYHESNTQRSDAPLAILSIDTLDLKVPIYNGTDEINLNRGAGRIKGTARVGSAGNLGIAAHRDGFFRVLKDIQIGDSMEMLTHQGKTEFVVSSITIVDPSDISVLAPTDDATITLVTCYPFYFVGHAPKRYIVKGELLSNQVNKS